MKRSGVRIPPAPPAPLPVKLATTAQRRDAMQGLTIRSATLTALLLIAILVAAACTDESRILTLKYWQAPTIPNPYLSAGDKDSDAAALTLEPLANYDPEGRITTKLADEIPTLENGDFAQDNLSITWRLIEGVKWSDGSDFTADDVVFTWRFCVDSPTGCTATDKLSGVKSVQALDDLTVRIEFKDPTPYPYSVFVGAKMPILSRAQYEGCLGMPHSDCPDSAHRPIGTGPYSIVEFSPQRSTFERNTFFRSSEPFFETVILLGGGDVETAEREVFETGEIDYVWNLQSDPKQLLAKQSLGNGIISNGFGSLVERIFVNQTNPDPALGDRRSEYLDGDNPHPFLTFRPITAAMSMAIDRQRISNELYDFAALPTCNIVAGPAEYISNGNDDCMTQNINGANRLLDANNVIDTDGDGVREYQGNPLRISFRTTTNATRQATQQLIKDWWEQIGIETMPIHADATFMFGEDNIRHANVSYSRFFADVQMYTETSGTDPEVYLSGQLCSHIQSRENGWSTSNNTRHCDPEYDATFAELTAQPLGPQRQALVKQLNDLIVSRNYQIPLVNRAIVSAHATNLHGVRSNAWDSQLWNIADWRRFSGE